MLPFAHQVAFLLFACAAIAFAARGFGRLVRRIRAGQNDTDARWNRPARRIVYALTTTLLQTRTFRKRPWVSAFHSLIFYGFVAYLLVNAIDALDGFIPLHLEALGAAGHIYTLLADVLSVLVLLGVIALVLRRFALPSRRDFRFNERTLLHPAIQRGSIARDSLIVSAFILFHVGSRLLGAAARSRLDGPDPFAPFASLVARAIPTQHALATRIFGYWGALGSVLAFLAYFPYSKHLHLIAAPVKYAVARDVNSGVLPRLDLDTVSDDPQLGAANLEQLAWPRLLDAYACIQCNRCQDVCPATATGKSLSPSALEINKRMELNQLAHTGTAFEHGASSPHPLLAFALTPEALWACTTCGACMQACPVQDEPMLDIIDIRRHQVMMQGDFPAPLQAAFRGMERSQNPWGTSHSKRMDWADGLNVKTTAENPEPDVLFWVGCAASYDPQSQKTARAFVQLLQYAQVDFAVLGKRECCTGDTARRAGNEVLYRQLAETNVVTLNEVRPKLIVATCPHCMNAIGSEYTQLGGNYEVMHHTEFLARLTAEGKLPTVRDEGTITFHDPCYLGRHNGVYDAPRTLLTQITTHVVEMPRSRENSFCCGAGGAQFWKEEEPGTERIAQNRLREAESTLTAGTGTRTLAVGCPFCKSMLSSAPGRNDDSIAVRDVAELLLEAVERKSGQLHRAAPKTTAQTSLPATESPATPAPILADSAPQPIREAPANDPAPTPNRKKWAPKAKSAAAPESNEAQVPPTPAQPAPQASAAEPPARKKWTPKQKSDDPSS